LATIGDGLDISAFLLRRPLPPAPSPDRLAA
jgi:hypothetical protein